MSAAPAVVGGGVVAALATRGAARSVAACTAFGAVAARAGLDAATTPVAARGRFFRKAAAGVVAAWATRAAAATVSVVLLTPVHPAVGTAVAAGAEFALWAAPAAALCGRSPPSPLAGRLVFDDTRVVAVRALERAARRAR